MSTEIVQRSPEQMLVARVRDEDFKQQVAMALPPTVTADRFVRVATTAILTNPEIAKIQDQNSILRAFVRAAADGLMPDGKEAAIVRRGSEAVYQPMVGGFRKIAAEYGWSLQARVVYANDDFEYSEQPPVLRHVRVRPGADRGDRVAAYAVATHKDGRREQRVMYADEILKRREMATTKQVWDKWPDQMWEKTPARDLFADLPLAENDLERERIKALLAESDLGQGDAARALYGDTDRPALSPSPSAVQAPVVKPSTTGPTDTTEHTGDDPQAGDAAKDTQTPSAAASPVPGQDTDDEPDVGAGGVATADDASIQLAADHAAMFQVPNGKYRGVPLGELMQQDGGEGWLRNRISVVTEPPEYVSALWNFARVYAPALYTEALAKKESEVQQ